MHHAWYAWILIGLIAGGLAARLTRVDTGGCLMTTLVGIAGGLVGGVIVDNHGDGDGYGFLASTLIAFVFACLFLGALRVLGVGSFRGRDRRLGRRP